MVPMAVVEEYLELALAQAAHHLFHRAIALRMECGFMLALVAQRLTAVGIVFPNDVWIINVLRDFGASGDGVNDDSEASTSASVGCKDEISNTTTKESTTSHRHFRMGYERT